MDWVPFTFSVSNKWIFGLGFRPLHAVRNVVVEMYANVVDECAADRVEPDDRRHTMLWFRRLAKCFGNVSFIRT